jgi:hypothetical protein
MLYVLRELPGARQVAKVPDPQLGNVNYTHHLTLPGVGPVFLTLGALESSSTPNLVRVWVSSPHATPQQQRALVAVVKHVLNRCHGPSTPQQSRALQRVAQQNWWLDLGQQEQQVGSLKINWSGREGLNVGGYEVSGIYVEWPKNQGLCTW